MVRAFLLGCLAAFFLPGSGFGEEWRFQVEWFEWEKPQTQETAACDAHLRKLPPPTEPLASLTVSAHVGEPSVTTARVGDELLCLLLLAGKGNDNCVQAHVELEHVHIDRENGVPIAGKFYPGRRVDRINSAVVLKHGQRYVFPATWRQSTDKNGRVRTWYSTFAITVVRPKDSKTNHLSGLETEQTSSPSQ